MKKFNFFSLKIFSAVISIATLCSYMIPLNTPDKADNFHLVNFNVKQQSNARIVTWTDTNEDGLDHFELQRGNSSDDRFTTVYSVYPQQNIFLTLTFFNDVGAISGNTVYYQLVSVYKDGNLKRSNLIFTRTDINDQITVYPNPAIDHISISFGSLVKRANIKIANQQGIPLLVVNQLFR